MLLSGFCFKEEHSPVNDSYMTFETLKYLSISLVFYSSYSVLNKLLYSMELVKQLLVITILGCTIKIVCNFIFVNYLGQNGLALSSSISYVFFFGSSLILVKLRLKFSLTKIIFHKTIFVLFNALISFTLARITLLIFTSGKWPALLTGIFGIIVFVVIFSLNILLIETNRVSGLYRIFSVGTNFRGFFTPKN